MKPTPTLLEKRQKITPPPPSRTSKPPLSTPTPPPESSSDNGYYPLPTAMPKTSATLPASYIIGFGVAMFVIVGSLSYFIFKMIQRRQATAPDRAAYIRQESSTSNISPSSDTSPTPLIPPVYPPSSPTYAAYAPPYTSQTAQSQPPSPYYRATTTSSSRPGTNPARFDTIPAPVPSNRMRNKTDEPPPPYFEG
jgi:hypothetical protein